MVVAINLNRRDTYSGHVEHSGMHSVEVAMKPAIRCLPTFLQVFIHSSRLLYKIKTIY